MSPPRTHPGGTRRPGGRAVTTLTIERLGEQLARIRTIKPNFFQSLTIADLSLTTRLTFIGLWTHVDDDGRAVDDARLIKAAVWPLDDRTAAEVEKDLEELATVVRSDGGRGLIQRYQVGGRRYLCIANWREHQRIDKPTASKLPPPPAPQGPDDGSRADALREGSGRTPGGLREGSREGGGGSPKPLQEQDIAGKTPGVATGHAVTPRQPVDNSPNRPLTSGSTDSKRAPGGLLEGSTLEGKGTGNREQGKEDLQVPAVGGLTDRNARASAAAPPAQPEIFIARSIVASIPRYRTAPGWVKSKHLAPMTAAALAAGFGRDAIVRYAAMVIGEGRFADHQHIPEFRDALRRLGRDAELGHACPVCARDPGGTWCCTEDRLWTADDQAALERALDALRPTLDELAQEA